MSIISCITNDVTKNDCANAVLAAGGSPIMAHHTEEIAEVQSFSKALLLNLGATYDYEAMYIALNEAKALGHPVVLDPVGVAGIAFRRKALKKLLEIGGITCIRGNYNEIAAVIGDVATGSGLDAEARDREYIEKLAENMRSFSATHQIMLVASGATDIATDGNSLEYIEAGSPWMSHITGAGCMVSAVLATRLACHNSFKTVVNTTLLYGKCGEKAAEKTMAEKKGTGTFHIYFMDELSKADWEAM